MLYDDGNLKKFLQINKMGYGGLCDDIKGATRFVCVGNGAKEGKLNLWQIYSGPHKLKYLGFGNTKDVITARNGAKNGRNILMNGAYRVLFRSYHGFNYTWEHRTDMRSYGSAHMVYTRMHCNKVLHARTGYHSDDFFPLTTYVRNKYLAVWND